MKLLSTCLVLLAALTAFSGCGSKEITTLQRKQAANLASEAQFASTIRDYARAEGLLAQATALCPDTPVYWLDLGSTRVRLGQRDGARAAYKQALKAFEDAEARAKTNSDPAIQQVYVLALLGRVDDARALQTRLLKRYPNDRNVRLWVEQKRLERMLADPAFKQFAL